MNRVRNEEASFGDQVRSLREVKGIGLRRFAERVGMSATYLSKIERGEFLPPSQAKVRAIAVALGQDVDEFLALAGRLPPDLPGIIRKQPREMAAFLRTAQGLPSSRIRQLTDQAASMRQAIRARRAPLGERDEETE